MKFTIRLIAAAVLVYASCTLFSFVIAAKIAETIWKQLGITPQTANDKIKNSFLDGYLHLEGVKNLRNIGDRAAATTELLTYTKQYLSTPYFKAAYAALRKDFHLTETQADPSKDLVRLQKQYPEDVRVFIKGRIQQYLSLAATVDFSATTHDKGGKQVFDKADYQYKSNDWKMIYRAGKEVYDVTRPFAEKWLQELQ